MKNISARYKQLKKEASAESHSLQKKMGMIGWLRLFLFVGFLFFFYDGIKQHLIWMEILSGGMLIAFFIYVKNYVRLTFLKKIADERIRLNTMELQAQKGDSSGFNPGEEYIDHHHSFTYDLDIFGKASLFQTITRTSTLAGKKRLAGWLQHPSVEKKEILRRQEALRELAGEMRWRQFFYAYGQILPEEENDRDDFIRWIKTPAVFNNKTLVNILIWVIPGTLLLLICLWIFGLLSYQVPLYYLLIPAIIEGAFLKKINHYHQRTSRSIQLLQKYTHLLNHIENHSFSSGTLQDLTRPLYIKNTPAGKAIQQLLNRFNLLDARNNIIVGVLLNLLMLWDFRILMSLDRWLQQFGKEVSRWFDVIAEMDALNSLAAFSVNHPGFVFPDFEEKGPLFKASNLGHPLIPDRERINNDFTLSGEGEFHIITGPNMAGKSTFLRTVGVNLLLAHIGAPVCATTFTCRISQLYTGMRTSDSLEKHESYFFAELNRIRMILDALQNKKLPVVILLDEILKGTNSQDKATGSQAVLQKMIRLGGAGIIATHDLVLTKVAKTYPENIITECFEAIPVRETIRFDYKLYPGITQHMNATFLMKQLGIID